MANADIEKIDVYFGIQKTDRKKLHHEFGKFHTTTQGI